MNDIFQINNRLGVGAKITTLYTLHDLVKITGDETVEKAGAGDTPVGFIRFVTKDKEKVTVETFFDLTLIMKAKTAITAGDRVKIAAPDTDGTQCVEKLGESDPETFAFGICWSGATTGGTVKILA